MRKISLLKLMLNLSIVPVALLVCLAIYNASLHRITHSEVSSTNSNIFIPIVLIVTYVVLYFLFLISKRDYKKYFSIGCVILSLITLIISLPVFGLVINTFAIKTNNLRILKVSTFLFPVTGYAKRPFDSQNYNISYLHYATWHGDLDTLEFLLEKNKNIDLPNKTTGKTSLHYAVEYCKFQNAKLLLAKGANKSISDNSGDSFLSYLKKSKCKNIGEFRQWYSSVEGKGN